MYKIQIGTEYLDGEFQIGFELSNQIFTGSSTSVLPGSYSLPFDVPLTRTNKRLLRNPQLLDNARPWRDISEVWASVDGVALLCGTLQLKGATPGKASLALIINPLAKLKSLSLRELDLGGTRSTGPMLFHVFMKTTAENPENYDFAFFPVRNPNKNGFPDVSGDPDPVLDNEFQNYYSQLTSPPQEFSEASGACTPFVRLDYLLRQMFAGDNTGYTFENAWQTTEELRRLYLYNNYDIRVLNPAGEPRTPIQFKLNPHVPDLKSTEFLKKVVAQHCLGVFTNVFSRKIRLVAIADLLKRETKHDWTKYAVGEAAIEDVEPPPSIFNYDQPGEAIPNDLPAPYNLKTYATIGEYGGDLPPDGYYYIESLGAISKKEPLHDTKYKQFQGVSLDGGSGLTYETGMQSMLSRERYYESEVEVSRWHKVDTDGTITYERRIIEPPVALMWYRGMQGVGGDLIENVDPMPYAANHIWLPDDGYPAATNRITSTGKPPVYSTRSLNWYGEHGLYNTAHRAFSEMLRNGKPIKQKLVLPIAVITAFSFEDKVRIGNMDFFAKKLKLGTSYGDGRVEVEASLVTIF